MSGNDRGETLIETMIAVLIALLGVLSLGSLVFMASATSKNQGAETTRAVIYAQDKMEKLLSLASVPVSGAPDFATCTQTPSSQPSVCNTTGVTSVTGWTYGLLAGGSISSSLTTLPLTCPSMGANVGYMDFLDSTGTQFDGCAANPPTAAYIRQWQITDANTFGSAPALKEITVEVWSLSAVNTNSGKPVVVLTSEVSNPN
jgi:hypothetical protein